MAGSNSGFDASAFRSAIRFVQDMAAAPLEGERVTFMFPSQLVYTAPADGLDVPFDPAATVQRVVPPTLQVSCAVEYVDATGDITSFGFQTATRVVITLLDEEYEQVKDANAVIIKGDRYLYRRTEPPTGLFDVGLYRMHFHAENET